MRRTALALALAAPLVVAASLAHGAEQARDVAPFSAVEASGAMNVTVDVGAAQSVRVTGSDAFVDNVRTEVVDGRLKLSMRHSSDMHLNGKTQVLITVPALRAFQMSGVGDIRLQHVGGDALDVTFGGAGSLRADGHVKSLRLHVGGVGDVDTRGLQAEDADVDLGGVGSAKVTATGRLDASVGGVGSLTYYGHPKVLHTSGGGLGSIERGD